MKFDHRHRRYTATSAKQKQTELLFSSISRTVVTAHYLVVPMNIQQHISSSSSSPSHSDQKAPEKNNRHTRWSSDCRRHDGCKIWRHQKDRPGTKQKTMKQKQNKTTAVPSTVVKFKLHDDVTIDVQKSSLQFTTAETNDWRMSVVADMFQH